MKSHIGSLFAVGMASLVMVVTVVAISLPPCGLGRSSAAQEPKADDSGGLPPLEIDMSAPLLLDEAPPTLKSPVLEIDPPAADNSACYVCHENLRGEEVVQWHARAPEKFGCVSCHGDSYAHRNDENNVTPPDVMYPATRVDRACKKCHETHNAPARDVLARFQERCPPNVDLETVICTDCHGQHRLKVRTVRWNKRNGKLITAPKPLLGKAP